MNAYQENRAELIGTVAEKITPDLQYEEGLMYKTFLHVRRKEGEFDSVMIVADKQTFKKRGIGKGLKVRIEGEVQTRNEYDSQNIRHVITYVRVKKVHKVHTEIPDSNKIILTGTTTKMPTFWRLNSSTRRANFILCTNDFDGKWMSFIPCVAWNTMADILCELPKGEELSFEGRFHSRDYEKTQGEEKEKRKTSEVSVIKLI